MDEQLIHSLLVKINKGREDRNIEFKESMEWHCDYAQGTIIKTILAMSNIQDGGTIVIGVKEDKKTHKVTYTGINKEYIQSYIEEDMKRKARMYADPFVNFTVDTINDNQIPEKTYVTIKVHEFEYSPVICKKEWHEYGLYKGKIYTRRDDPPESSMVDTEYFMREIIDLAVAKYYRKTLELQKDITSDEIALADKIKKNFEKELGDWK